MPIFVQNSSTYTWVYTINHHKWNDLFLRSFSHILAAFKSLKPTINLLCLFHLRLFCTNLCYCHKLWLQTWTEDWSELDQWHRWGNIGGLFCRSWILNNSDSFDIRMHNHCVTLCSRKLQSWPLSSQRSQSDKILIRKQNLKINKDIVRTGAMLYME